MTPAITLKDGAQALRRGVETHKELFWSGVMTRRVDCCDMLMVPGHDDIDRAVIKFMEQASEAEAKDQQAIYKKIAEELELAASGSDFSPYWYYGFAESVYRIYFQCINQAQASLTEYYHAKTGLHPNNRTAKIADRAHHAYRWMTHHLSSVGCEIVPIDKLYRWRQQMLRHNPTVRLAYATVINHMDEWDVIYEWQDDGKEVQEWLDHYSQLLEEEPPKSFFVAGYQEMVFNCRHLLSDPGTSRMIPVHSVVWNIVNQITPALDHRAVGMSTEEEQTQIFFYTNFWKRLMELEVKRG